MSELIEWVKWFLVIVAADLVAALIEDIIRRKLRLAYYRPKIPSFFLRRLASFLKLLRRR